MDNFEDYYDILRVADTATFAEIKQSYDELIFIWHPDRHPDRVKKRAEEEAKRLNRAYSVLSKQPERAKYDTERRQHTDGSKGSAGTRTAGAPKPVVDPYHIEFKNTVPGYVRKASFTVFNTGGHYSKININNPDSWLRVVAWHSLSTTDELPLKIDIEAIGKDGGKRYSDVICVSLDNVQAKVNVVLTTRMRLEIKDHGWHDIDFDNLKAWVRKRKDVLDTGRILRGKVFRYRFNTISRKYQIRLRRDFPSAVYDPGY